MTQFYRRLAVAGIIWAILVPCILFLRELSDSRSMELHTMAYNLHVLIPKEPATNSTVTLPLAGISNWADTLYSLAVRDIHDTSVLLSVILASSGVIIVLAICILKAKRDEKIAA